MAKVVFTTQPGTRYDDLPEVRYHFPNRGYLAAATAAVGDEVVYYEPGRTTGTARTGSKTYFAVATVERVVPDDANPSHSYAYVKSGSFINFPHPVSLRRGDGVCHESSLRGVPAERVGALMRGTSVRALSDQDFQAILQTGFARPIGEERGRPRVPAERAWRDPAFTDLVREAYDNTCVLTGLRIVNGGGWTEAQAAHIRPVKDQGPDSIRNGILLSSTMHALFDRGFLGLVPHDDTYKVLVAPAGLPESLRMLIPRDGLIDPQRLPKAKGDRPHREFVQWHRDTVFKKEKSPLFGF